MASVSPDLKMSSTKINDAMEGTMAENEMGATGFN